MPIEANQPPIVQHKVPSPPGVLPRNAQAWVICGLATVMVIVIVFSGRNAPPPKPAPVPPLAAVTDPNQGRIREYRDRIDEQVRKLKEEQAQLAREQAVATVASLPESPRPLNNSRAYEYPHSPSYVHAPPDRSWVEEDREKRNYLSLYAPNVALSYRDPSGPHSSGERLSGPIGDLERVLVRSRPSKPNGADEHSALADESADERRKGHDQIDQAVGSKYRLFEGTVIETVLTNRLDGAFSGPVNCMVTSDIYSHNSQHVVIPAGTRVLGEANRVDAFGQERLAVVFHRLIMPDGYTESLDKFRGLNQIGETGLHDQANHHYLQVFGVSIAIGAIAGLSQANTRSGGDNTAADAYRQGVSASLSQSSLRILDRYLNVLPTITIREGQRVKIYLADDLLLPAFENHRMPNEL